MVRTLTPRLKTGFRTLVLPGTSEAEPWDSWVGETCVGSSSSPGPIGNSAGSTLALPVGKVASLPLWLNETDETKFDDIVELQLEIRGLQVRGNPAIFDWTLIAKEAKRTLVLVGVLAANLPAELEASACSAFDVSARCFQFPEDALVIWQEQGYLAIGISRGAALCYFQALDDSAISQRAIQDLTCVLASLQMQEIVDRLRLIVFWTDELPTGAANLGAALELPITHDERPAPLLPPHPWKLTPARVRVVKRQRSARRWRTFGIIAVLVLLVSLLLGLGTRLFMTSQEIVRLQRWQTAHASALESIQDSEAKWKSLQPVVNTKTYPLEILLQISNSLPREEVHLTLFEANGNHLLIKAEAKNLPAATQFFDAVKRSPQLKAFSWEMSQPHSLANDLTQIELQGTLAP